MLHLQTETCFLISYNFSVFFINVQRLSEEHIGVLAYGNNAMVKLII
jgi:hypothetical protein